MSERFLDGIDEREVRENNHVDYEARIIGEFPRYYHRGLNLLRQLSTFLRVPRKNRVMGWGGVALYCGLIFFLSAQQNLSLPDIPSADKGAHLLEYSGLGWVCAYAWRHEHPGLPIFATLVFSTTFASVYGASDEWHQAYVPGRSSDWRDWLADTCGGFIGGALYIFWIRIKAVFGRRPRP